MTDQRRPFSFTSHLDPPDQPWPDELVEEMADARRLQHATLRTQRERVRKAQRAEEDARKRAWIEAGNELRQPPEYRGRVFDHADHDGVHPTAFPPLRYSPQDGLSDEFITFQAYNQTRYATHPEYYCVRCQIRYNARVGGLCGPCIGQTDEVGQRRRRRAGERPPEYPM